MLMPKRVKHRKQHRGRMTGKAWRGSSVSFGDYGLQALEPCWMSSRQIEAARRAIVRYVRRGGKIWIRIFPDKPVTKRAAETRMGSGKGPVEHYVAVIRPGRVLLQKADQIGPNFGCHLVRIIKQQRGRDPLVAEFFEAIEAHPPELERGIQTARIAPQLRRQIPEKRPHIDRQQIHHDRGTPSRSLLTPKLVQQQRLATSGHSH